MRFLSLRLEDALNIWLGLTKYKILNEGGDSNGYRENKKCFLYIHIFFRI